MKQLLIEIISFGNELLLGEITNTNSQWLAHNLTGLGVKVSRMMTLSDDLDHISSGFIESLTRRPDIIISTGGLGPTWDDKTLIGLSNAIDEELEMNEEGLNMISKKYDEMGITMSDASKKMANMPKNSVPLHNSVGTAPGIFYQEKSSVIYCLPGVPKEMKAIFTEHILPYIGKINPEISFIEQKFIIQGSYESKISKITTELTKKYPSIYIKSHPQESQIKMHITTYGNEESKKLLEKVTQELISNLSNIKGVKIK